ncbi:DUF1345 domain-containing protein [Gordonia sp. i37]|uniref:DUF1345 domain-containing protein n=2 Tax=unclassified Gordonia (in: high G+C Gram-positive bacteria) TaxID=2657482 RepID=UPI00209B1A4E|nr:DUF1345 domain-containing protein [Gordonia sp. i37]
MRTLRALSLLEMTLAVLGLIWLAYLINLDTPIGLIVAWDLFAMAYLATGWVRLRNAIPLFHDDDIPQIFGPRWHANVFALIVSCTGLAGGVLIVVRHNEDDGFSFVKGAAALTILLSWLLLHVACAQIYARASGVDGGLDFPDCPEPGIVEYVYFSVTIGTSFAVSDVTITSTAMRRRVITHSIVSFFFNAIVIAIAIDWIKS